MLLDIEWSTLYSDTLQSLEIFFDYVYCNYVDIYYINWLMWVCYPLVLTFVLPVFIALFIYASALFLQIYRLRSHLKDACAQDFWDGARQILATLWIAQARTWHGYEVRGFEKIPAHGPAILIYYHGAIPIDFYYLLAKTLVDQKRLIRAVGDRFLFKIPGLKTLMEVFCVTPGTVSCGVEVMRQGHLLAIAPGGVREAYFSDECYQVMWGDRIGFAKIAVEAQVPIIPVFTQNCREAFRALSLGRFWFRKIYERTRLPIVPIYGMFPVKLRTFIGDPIFPDPNISPEELRNKVEHAVKNLIKRHQRIPGTIIRALVDRVLPNEDYS